MNTHTLAELKQRQALPLEVKVLMSKQRIREWIDEFGEDGVYVSFSGGKDSTVLLHLVREDFPNVKAMFVDTGLEYPEVRAFAMAQENVDVVRPKLTFKEVIKTKGYPFIGKEVSKNIYYARRAIEKGDMENIHLKKMNGELKDENGERSSFNTEKYKFMVDAPYLFGDGCCAVMKKSPAHAYEKATGRVKITGQMADESRLRMQKWLRSGCSGSSSSVLAFSGARLPSRPNVSAIADIRISVSLPEYLCSRYDAILSGSSIIPKSRWCMSSSGAPVEFASCTATPSITPNCCDGVI